jgi:hypothetical protein
MVGPVVSDPTQCVTKLVTLGPGHKREEVEEVGAPNPL